jgi:hypothetical protein
MDFKNVLILIFLVVIGCKSQSKFSITCDLHNLKINCIDDFYTIDSFLPYSSYIDTTISVNLNNISDKSLRITLNSNYVNGNDELFYKSPSDEIVVKFYNADKKEIYSTFGFYNPDLDFNKGKLEEFENLQKDLNIRPHDYEVFSFRFNPIFISQYFYKVGKIECQQIKYLKFCINKYNQLDKDKDQFHGSASTDFIEVLH